MLCGEWIYRGGSRSEESSYSVCDYLGDEERSRDDKGIDEGCMVEGRKYRFF